MSRGYDGTINIDSRIDSGGFNKGVSSMLGKLAPLGKAITSIFSVGIGINAVASVTKLAAEFSRLGIASQAVGMLHGSSADSVRKLVNELRESGIQSDIANQAYIGFAKEGLDSSLLPALARGAQDLNVFGKAGESSSDVLQRLTDGILTLNTEVLRNAGVAIDIDSVTKAAGATTILAKRQAVLAAVTEKLRGVSGLYELSQKTAAGQLSSNVRIMNEFKAAIGSTFESALFNLVKGFNTLVKSFTAAIQVGGRLHGLFVSIGAVASYLTSIISGFFNVVAGFFGADVSKGAANTAGKLEDSADAANSAASAQDSLAESTSAAGKAAKGSLASFDELSVLQNNDAGSGTAGGAGALDVGGIIDPSSITDPLAEVNAKVEEVKKKFLNFIGPVAGLIEEKLLPVLAKLGGQAWNGLTYVWENILKPFVTWLWENIVPVVIDGIAVALDILSDSFGILGPVVSGTVGALRPFATWLGEVLLSALGWIVEKLKDLRTWIGQNEDTWKAFLTILIAVGGFIFAMVAGPFAALIAIILGVGFILSQVGDTWDLWVNNFELGMKILKKIFGPVGETIRGAFIGAFNAIRDAARSIFNNVIGFVEGMVRGVVNGINTIILAANTVAGILPGSPSVGYVTAPSIPRLATGAVIPPNAEFAAILGDQKSGTNIEAPENLIRQIIQEEIGNIRADISVSFEGTLGALVRELKPLIDAENVRIGGSLLSSRT